MLQSVGLQRVGHNLETEQQHCCYFSVGPPSWGNTPQVSFLKLNFRDFGDL